MKSAQKLPFLLLIIFIFLFSTKQSYACSETNIQTLIRQSSCEISTCSDGKPMCQVNPGTNTCNSNQQIWNANITLRYTNNTECTSTVLFTSLAACDAPDFDANGIKNQPGTPYCSTFGTCNESLNGQPISPGNQIKYQFTGTCEIAANSYCTGGYTPVCSRNASGTGPGTWCEGWGCGWDCNGSTNYTCQKHYDSLSGADYPYNTGGGAGYNQCDAECDAPPPPTSTPVPPTPTPVAPTATPDPGNPGNPVGPSCSGTTFSGCNVPGINDNCCDWSADWNACSQYCSGGCSVKANVCVAATPTVPPSYSVGCANDTTMTVSGTSCSGCVNGFDTTSGGWAFQNVSVPSSNTVVSGHSIQVSVNGVNQGSPTTCGSPPPQQQTSLNCLGCGFAWDEPKWRTGTASENPGCQGATANMFPAVQGTRCYQPGGGSSPPTGSTLVGRFINNATGQSIYAAGPNGQMWHWVYNGTCVIGSYWNGTWLCLQENSYQGAGGMDYAIGTPPVTNDQDQTWYQIFDWPQGLQPVSYSSYQSMGRNCQDVWECVKSCNNGCGGDNACGVGCEECLGRDQRCGSWECTSSATPTSSGSISFTRGVTNTIPAPICNPGDSQPRVDIYFDELKYTVSGSVRDDVNADTVCSGDGLYAGAFTVTNNQSASITYPSSGTYLVDNLTPGSSTTTLQAPAGYGITSPNAVSSTVGPNQTVNFCVSKFYHINPAPNPTANIFVDYNHNGARDAEDVAYTGQQATIALSGKASASTTSDAQGKFWFFNLYAGNYTTTLTVPANYVASDFGCLGQTTCAKSVTLGPDKTVTYAITPLYTISGTVWNDYDKDKVRDGGEPNYNGGTSNFSFRNIAAGTTTTASTATGIYTSGQTLLSGMYLVSYNTVPTNWEITYTPGTPPSFIVTVGKPGTSIACNPQVHNAATCDGQGNIINLHFGISDSIVWFHCEGGDCRFDNGVSNRVPSSASAACGSSYADIQSTSSNTPGVVFTGDSNSDLGAGQASPNPYNWLVGGSLYPETFSPASTGIIRASYEYIDTKARQGGITPTDLAASCGAGGIANCSLSAAITNGFYKASGPLTLNSATGTYSFPKNKNFVILVNGNLTINTKILVPNGSTVTFLVKGNITINKSLGQVDPATRCVPPIVKDAYSTGCDVEGFYAADGNITIDGNGRSACSTVDPTDNDLRFNFAGSMVANAALGGGTITNNRDLCGGNRSCPTYAVVERPDFLLFAPDLVKFQNYIWQEIAP